MESDNMPKLSGLKYIVNLHKMSGISYLGYEVGSINVNHLCIKSITILWNLMILSFITATAIYQFTSGMAKATITQMATLLNPKKSSIITSIIYVGLIVQPLQS